MTSHPPRTEPPAGYTALRARVAWADLGGRSVLVARGDDAVRFIDNFTTAAVAARAVGQGTEGFFTDARGWIIAMATILRTDEGVCIDLGPGLSGPLREHLEHYHIRERVTLEDETADHACLLLAGPDAAGWLAAHADRRPPEGLFDHLQCRLDGIDVRLIAIDWTGPGGFLLQAAAADGRRLVDLFAALGVETADPAAVEAARIEQGRPEPADIREKTLPQELGRDARAISFTKGCYLGQETVARIDALGHVNRRLVAVATDASVPPRIGAEVHGDAGGLGTITSSCLSPLLGTGLGLVLLREGGAADGRRLDIDGVPARVVAVPLPAAAFSGDDAADVLLETRRFRVIRRRESCGDGTVRDREIVQHPGSVVILPLPSADEVCLVEVVRVAVGRTLLELPAGTLDRVETLEQAARRELAEETGYRAGRIRAAGEFWVSPGILRERMHLFVAEDLVAGEQSLEPGEQIRTRVVGWDEAVAMCLDGRIADAKTIAGLLLEDRRRRGGGA
ncbi:MAG: NUDIX domain-containing protein [Planctomycetia bacterium]|nr:NUDIX domain-containing protein [Planctomycetia bacterium]